MSAVPDSRQRTSISSGGRVVFPDPREAHMEVPTEVPEPAPSAALVACIDPSLQRATAFKRSWRAASGMLPTEETWGGVQDW